MSAPAKPAPPQRTTTRASDGAVTLSVPVNFRKRSGACVIRYADGQSEPKRTHPAKLTALQRALARGHRWLRMLETGEYASMTDIAKAESSEISYVARMINLTVLAPDIVAAILDETIADDAKVVDLAISPPMLWSEQRANAFGSKVVP